MVFLLGWLATGHSQGIATPITVEPSGDRAFDRETEAFADAADEDIRFFLTGTSGALPVIFHATDLPPEKSLLRTVRLDPTQPSLHRQLLIISALTKGRLPKSGPPEVPPWFVAGIYHRVHSRIKGQLPENRFPVSQAVVRNGLQFTLTKLMGTPPPASLPAVYEVYADMCAAMLVVFQRESVGALTRILLLKKPSDETAVAMVLAMKPESLNPWFKKRFNHIAASPRLTADKTATQLEMLIRTHLAPEKSETPIDDLVRTLDVGTVSKEAKRTFLTQCYQLRVQCPALLGNSLDRIIIAATALQSGKDRDFLKRLAPAWDAFRKNQRYATSLANYLKSQTNPTGEMLIYRPSRDNTKYSTSYTLKLRECLETLREPHANQTGAHAPEIRRDHND